MRTRQFATRRIGLGMLGLGIGYFLWYTPFSGLTKALSSGELPGTGGPVGGLVLLPGVALGMLCGMVAFLAASGWWRQARTRRRVPIPGRETLASAGWMALIVATTVLNFTFAGFPIVFMLVMMRIETIVLAPAIDLLHRRGISPYSWLALGLSLLSALIALTDVNGYGLSVAAFGSLALYLVGYAGRFHIMSRHAKTGLATDRRYFVEEHLATPVLLTLLLAVPALVNHGAAAAALRAGFTTVLTEPAGWYAIAIGLCYEGLFIFTTMIFLNPREYAFCVPVHVCASLLAGVVASGALWVTAGLAVPSTAQLMAAGCVVLAAFALSYPAIASRRQVRQVLFVCGGNRVRSAMAETIARAELASAVRRGRVRWVAGSAGVSVTRAGAPMADEAAEALCRLGLVASAHASRPLTPEMCLGSDAVYCMTEAQRAAVVAFVPAAAGRIFRLDPTADLAEPAGDGSEAYVDCAHRIRQLVRSRPWERVVTGSAGAPGGLELAFAGEGR